MRLQGFPDYFAFTGRAKDVRGAAKVPEKQDQTGNAAEKQSSKGRANAAQGRKGAAGAKQSPQGKKVVVTAGPKGKAGANAGPRGKAGAKGRLGAVQGPKGKAGGGGQGGKGKAGDKQGGKGKAGSEKKAVGRCAPRKADPAMGRRPPGAAIWKGNSCIQDRYIQVGNAVSPVVAAALGRCLVRPPPPRPFLGTPGPARRPRARLLHDTGLMPSQ